MTRPPTATPKEWETALERLRAKEKELTRAHDALAAERRRLPWVRIERDYAFQGPDGKARLVELFDYEVVLGEVKAFIRRGEVIAVDRLQKPGQMPKLALLGCAASDTVERFEDHALLLSC